MNDITVRTIAGNEVTDIARCFRTCPGWRKEYDLPDTEEIVMEAVVSLAIEVPPSDKPRRLFAHYMAGCSKALFIQVVGKNGRVQETDVINIGKVADYDPKVVPPALQRAKAQRKPQR